MWFKYGLKTHKLLAQGITLGIMAVNKAPCWGALCICYGFRPCVTFNRGFFDGIGGSRNYVATHLLLRRDALIATS